MPQPPAGLVPLADRELDQLVTQASNDNIPLIDLDWVAPDGDSAYASIAHRLGITPHQRISAAPHLDVHPQALVVFFDSESGADVAAF